MKNILRIALALVAMACTIQCEKPEEQTTPNDTIAAESHAYGSRAIVLCEGLQGNNASLTYMDLDAGKIINRWFEQANGRGLGNLAQDVVVYGSRAYVTVWASGSIEAINLANGRSTHVDLGERGPRYIACHGGKLYITCYKPHSVIRVDTATLAVEATCTLGGYNPEGLCALGGKLYVASDNIADATGKYTYDNKLYVVDIATFAVEDSIVVGVNPQKVMVIDSTHLMVNHWGEWDMTDFSTVGEGSAVVDVACGSVVPTSQLLSNMVVHQGVVYGYAQSYESGNNSVRFLKLDPFTLATEPILATSGITDPYAIAVHPESGNLYIGTHNNYGANGDLCCYSPTGDTLLWRREVGMLPSKVVFF